MFTIRAGSGAFTQPISHAQQFPYENDTRKPHVPEANSNFYVNTDIALLIIDAIW